MLANDVILRLVEMLMEEKDKNTKLQLDYQHKRQANDEKTSKD